MDLKKGGGYQLSTSSNPFSRYRTQKYSNYLQSASIPAACLRGDNVNAQRDGRAGREDY
jgi:hypothetical protein